MAWIAKTRLSASQRTITSSRFPARLGPMTNSLGGSASISNSSTTIADRWRVRLGRRAGVGGGEPAAVAELGRDDHCVEAPNAVLALQLLAPALVGGDREQLRADAGDLSVEGVDDRQCRCDRLPSRGTQGRRRVQGVPSRAAVSCAEARRGGTGWRGCVARASHARSESRFAGAIVPRAHSPVAVSIQSKVICWRCRSSPTLTVITNLLTSLESSTSPMIVATLLADVIRYPALRRDTGCRLPGSSHGVGCGRTQRVELGLRDAPDFGETVHPPMWMTPEPNWRLGKR